MWIWTSNDHNWREPHKAWLEYCVSLKITNNIIEKPNNIYYTFICNLIYSFSMVGFYFKIGKSIYTFAFILLFVLVLSQWLAFDLKWNNSCIVTCKRNSKMQILFLGCLVYCPYWWLNYSTNNNAVLLQIT